MPKVILFNKFRPSEQVRALVLVHEHKNPHKVALPDIDEFLREKQQTIQITPDEENNFSLGYFLESLEGFEVLDMFKNDIFDWHWIDLERFYASPLEYINKVWWDEMDRDDFLIFIKNKDKILQHFDRIKTS